MTYVLVSLVGDEATRDANALSLRLEERCPAASTYRDESPDVDRIEQSMAEVDAAVLFGHDGGGTLRAFSESERIWADALALGRIFGGARIYIYACDSFQPCGDSLAELAVNHGVRLVVGHDAPIGTPDPLQGYTQEQLAIVQDAALAMMVAFLGGETDERRLRGIGLRARLVHEQRSLLDIGPDGNAFFSNSLVLFGVHKSLRVVDSEQRG